MIALTATTQKLQAFLAGAAATTNPTIAVYYHDIPTQMKTDYSEYKRGDQFTTLAGTAETDICAAPAQGTVRHIDEIIAYNADTASVVLTICTDDDGTNRIHFKQTVATLRTFFYGAEYGWGIL